ncbi:MAG: FAD binding domain-containing protein [Acidocella sp.]|nr:FAD binding domain-containing protein [Acidocella sp.]
MKPAPFTWSAAPTLDAACGTMRAGGRAIAGGQSLGPMLNLRIAQPDRLVSIARISALCGVSETADDVTIGACVTHAQIEDGQAPDIGQDILPRVAANIAYRAVRNRGTIGGSLCHADPAADWVTVLLALGAQALTHAPSGSRIIALDGFFTGAFRTNLTPGEVLHAIRIPRLTPDARFGYYKICRKPGEFAHAMAAVFISKNIARVVIGALGTIPLVLMGAEATPDGVEPAFRSRTTMLDEVTQHMQLTAVKRAFARAAA